MKKICVLVIIGFILIQGLSVHANETNRVLLGFKYHNTSLWGGTTNEAYKKIVNQRILPIIQKNRYEMITDEKYINKLQAIGYADFASVERADLIDTYKQDGFRYIILVEVEPLRQARPFGYESSAYTKILDMNTEKYIYNGKIYKLTKWGGGGTVFEKIGDEIKTILDDKVFVL